MSQVERWLVSHTNTVVGFCLILGMSVGAIDWIWRHPKPAEACVCARTCNVEVGQSTGQDIAMRFICDNGEIARTRDGFILIDGNYMCRVP